MMPLYHTPPAHTKPTPGVFIGAAWLGWTLGVCGCPPGPAQTVGGLRLHLRLRVGLRLSHSDNLSSHIPTSNDVQKMRLLLWGIPDGTAPWQPRAGTRGVARVQATGAVLRFLGAAAKRHPHMRNLLYGRAPGA